MRVTKNLSSRFNFVTNPTLSRPGAPGRPLVHWLPCAGKWRYQLLQSARLWQYPRHARLHNKAQAREGIEEHRMRSTVGRLGLAMLVVLSASSQVSAQERSCAKVQPIKGTVGYQARSGDPRCEGFYQSPVSGANLE